MLHPARGPLLQRNMLTAQQLQLIVDVDDATLDEGSRLLKQMQRPPRVNDATADKLSNCALTTLAAIEGNRTSGAVATEMRASKGLPASSEQSRRPGR